MALGRKTGGRKKGVPNKNNPLKGYLRDHSEKYFTPNSKGRSQFDKDMDELEPSERVSAELRLLEFSQPRMKAVDMSMEVGAKSESLLDKIAAMCNKS